MRRIELAHLLLALLVSGCAAAPDVKPAAPAPPPATATAAPIPAPVVATASTAPVEPEANDHVAGAQDAATEEAGDEVGGGQITDRMGKLDPGPGSVDGGFVRGGAVAGGRPAGLPADGQLGHPGESTGTGAGGGKGRGGGSLRGIEDVWPSGKITLATLTTSGAGLSREVIRRRVTAQLGQLRRCYSTGLQKNPSLAGKITVKFTIGTDGIIWTSSAGDTDVADTSMVKCVVGKVHGIRFPDPEGGAVQVTSTLQFSPDK